MDKSAVLLNLPYDPQTEFDECVRHLVARYCIHSFVMPGLMINTSISTIDGLVILALTCIVRFTLCDQGIEDGIKQVTEALL